MGIRETLAAHDARFISFAELLKAVAEAEGVTAQEAARAFSVCGFMLKVRHRLRNFVDGAYAECNGGAAWYELEKAMSPESVNCMYDQVQSDYAQGEPGFFKDEIAVPLAECGFAVPRSITSRIPEAPRTNAESDLLHLDLVKERERSAALEAELVHLRDKREAVQVGQNSGRIKGKTFGNLEKVLAEFPVEYKGRDFGALKLDVDVRPWIKNLTSCSNRESHVFGTIVAEHFGLK